MLGPRKFRGGLFDLVQDRSIEFICLGVAANMLAICVAQQSQAG